MNKKTLTFFLVIALFPTTYIGAETKVDLEAKTIIHVGNGANSTNTASTSVETDDAEMYGGVNEITALEVNALGVAITSSTQVNSDADLRVFSENMTAKNSNVSKIVISSEEDEESEVVVVYRHRGKLFGFIPVSLKSVTSVKAEANSSIEVNSGLSWWSFLVAGENYSGTELKSSIENNTTVKANMSADASAGARARVTEAVVTELRTNAMTEASS